MECIWVEKGGRGRDAFDMEEWKKEGRSDDRLLRLTDCDDSGRMGTLLSPKGSLFFFPPPSLPLSRRHLFSSWLVVFLARGIRLFFPFPKIFLYGGRARAYSNTQSKKELGPLWRRWASLWIRAPVRMGSSRFPVPATKGGSTSTRIVRRTALVLSRSTSAEAAFGKVAPPRPASGCPS